MREFNFTDLELNDEISRSSLASKHQEKSLLNSIFEFYSMVYYEKKPKEKSFRSQKIKLIIEGIIWCLQIASLLWIPNLQINDWKNNKEFWKLIGYIRLDNLCSEYELISSCIYSSVFIVTSTIIGLFAIFILLYCSVPIPRFIIRFSKNLFYTLLNILSVPIPILFCVCLKYNWFPENNILEYEQSNNDSSFKVSIPLQILIVFGLIGHYFINIMSKICSAEIRHSVASQIIESKAYSVIDIYVVSLTAIMPILYVMIGANYIVIFQTILMVISTIFMMETLKMMPHFNLFMNCLVSIKFLEISLLSFLFIFAKIIDASLIVALSIFTLIPLSTIIAIQLIKKNSKMTSFAYIVDDEKSIYKVEQNLRHLLSTNDKGNRNKIFSFLGQLFNETKHYKNKLLAVWETNYCIFTLEDEALAKIKLCKSKFSDNSLEGNYQEFLCKKNVSTSSANEGLIFLDFFKKINQIKNQDEFLCIELIDFWSELVSSHPNIKRLNIKLDLISQSAPYLEETYSNLNEKFPKSKEALNCYLTFIKQILCDQDKSSQLNYKFQTLEEWITPRNQVNIGLSFFDENNGIMLISCENTSFGVILYANQKASEILRYPINQIIENKFSSFIPPPYDWHFSSQGQDFINSISDIEIKLPSHIFLLLPNKFIIDCNCKVLLSSISDHLVILLAFQEIIMPQEYAIVSSELEICCHSKNFSILSHSSSKELAGYNIKEIFSSLKHTDFEHFTPYLATGIDTETYLIPCYIEFYGERINYIILVSDPRQIETWKSYNPIQNAEQPPLSNNILDLPQQKYEVNDNFQKVELSQHSESYSWYLRFDKITNLSSRSIRIFHFVFVSAVLFI